MSLTTTGRTWTDEQLTEAVASSRSWRAVARVLGLKDTSAGVIRTLKRHAARLGVDAAHFTGQRKWSDGQLRREVIGSTCWAEVLRGLDVMDNAESRVRVKGHAARLGLDITHLKSPLMRPSNESALAEAADPLMLRVAAPAIAMAWFAVRGYPVALPVEPQEYDLLVTMGGEIRRVQVKSSTCQLSNGQWQVQVGRRPYALDKTAGKAPYDPDALDYFFIVTAVGCIYLVPSRVLAGRVCVYADSYASYQVGDASSLLH